MTRQILRGIVRLGIMAPLVACLAGVGSNFVQVEARLLLTTYESSAIWQTSSATTSPSEPNPLKKLREEWERIDIKENFPRYAAFTILRPYLPAETKFTSGFRTPENQLRVIRDLALRYNSANPSDPIPIPPSQMTVNSPNTWEPTLQALRARHFFVSSPKATPHATGEVVFDMSGNNLNAIREACVRAERMGLMSFNKVLIETANNAVHVEVKKVEAKALMLLGTNSISQNPSASPEQNKQLLQYLTEQHDKETSPARKIESDRERMKLLDPADLTNIGKLEEEIKQHEREITELEKKEKKKVALVAISQANQEGRSEDALRLANDFAKEFPDEPEAKDIVARIE